MAKVVQITAENFETEVIQASETRAVAVLFSSAEYPDCGPYSQLMGQLSTSMDFTLGVVSCDERENMRLIQAFRVQSVPEVHVVDKGQIADVIAGVLPEADLKKRLEKFFVSDEARFQMALEDAIAQKNFDQAIPMLEEALSKTPDDKKLQLLWAKASLGLGDTEKAKTVLQKFNEGDDQYREAKSLLELLDFHAEAAKKDVTGKEAIVYHEACKLACAEDFESAQEGDAYFIRSSRAQARTHVEIPRQIEHDDVHLVAAGCWSLVTGCRSLAISYWPSDELFCSLF